MDKLLNTQEVADWIGLSRRTLEGWRLKSEGPVFLILGDRVRYRREDVQAWLDGKRILPKKEAE